MLRFIKKNKPALIINADQIIDNYKDKTFCWDEIEIIQLENKYAIDLILFKPIAKSKNILQKVLKRYPVSTSYRLNIYYIDKEPETILASFDKFDHLASENASAIEEIDSFGGLL